MITALLLGICAQTRLWSAEERLTVTSFNEVHSVAVDSRRVFASGPNGIEIYDYVFQRWLAPTTSESGYPPAARVWSSAYDRTQAGLWLNTSTGMFFRSDLNGRVELRSFASGDPEVTRLLQRGAQQSDIALAVLRGTMGVDSYGRRWPITAVANAERQGTYYVGTNGNNLLFADSRNLSTQPLLFGTLSRGVSAFALDTKGNIWFGGDGAGPRNGISIADSTLQRWQWMESLATAAPRGQINRILVGDTTWVSSSDGLFSYSGGRWRRYRSLPSDNVRPILKRADGLWVGTRSGLVILGTAVIAFAGTPINGLAERADTVYVATPAGLFAYHDGVRTELSKSSTQAVAVTPTGLAVLDANGLSVHDAAIGAIGRAYDLRSTADALYVLGTRGFVEISFDGKPARYLTTGSDLPDGPVKDVLRIGNDVWVATPAGATRLRWPR